MSYSTYVIPKMVLSNFQYDDDNNDKNNYNKNNYMD